MAIRKAEENSQKQADVEFEQLQQNISDMKQQLMQKYVFFVLYFNIGTFYKMYPYVYNFQIRKIKIT